MSARKSLTITCGGVDVWGCGRFSPGHVHASNRSYVLTLIAAERAEERLDEVVRDAHRREAAVVVEVLHRDYPRVIAEERHDEVGAGGGVGVAEGGEHLGEVEHRVEAGDAAAGAGAGRTLADGAIGR